MKTRVLIISDFYFPYWTGIASTIHQIAKLIANYADVHVLTVKHEPQLESTSNLDNITIHRVPPRFNISRSQYAPGMIPRGFALARSADVVLINSPCANIFPLSVIAKVLKKKLIIFHNGDLILPAGTYNRMLEKLFDINTLIAVNLADSTASYTLDYAQHSRILSGSLSKFTSFLLKPPKMLSGDKKLSKKLEGLNKQYTPIIGFAGRFVEEKGFDLLLNAIPKITAKLPRARFVFAGKINMGYEKFFQQHLTTYQRVKKYVTLLGLLDPSQMASFYDYIDLIAIPSRSDCYNFVQTEAMYAGVPSVVNDAPGVRYLVAHTEFGQVCDAKNPTALADAIVEVATGPEKYRSRHQKVVELLESPTHEKKLKELITS